MGGNRKHSLVNRFSDWNQRGNLSVATVAAAVFPVATHFAAIDRGAGRRCAAFGGRFSAPDRFDPALCGDVCWSLLGQRGRDWGSGSERGKVAASDNSLDVNS